MGSNLGFWFGIVSATLQLLGYGIYFKEILAGRCKPNFASWGLWAFGSLVSVIVYQSETNDIAKWMLPITCATCSVLIWLYSFSKSKLVAPDLFDWGIVALDLIVISVWFYFRNTHFAYYLLLFDTAITFIPIMRSAFENPHEETPLAWLVWSGAYSCLILVAIVNWEGVLPILLPILYLVLHFAIYFILHKRRRLFSL